MPTTNLKAKTVTAATAGNYAQANSGLDQIDLAITEKTSISVVSNVDWSTGSNDQDPATGRYKALRTSIVEMTGVQGAARTFTVPNDKKWYFVNNICTGGFNTTFKTPLGTGIAIANATKKKLYCNGTDIEDWT